MKFSFYRKNSNSIPDLYESDPALRFAFYRNRLQNLYNKMTRTTALTSLSVALAAAASAAPLVKEVIISGLEDPMELAIAPDGTFFVTEREGRLLRINPETGALFEIGHIAVEHLKATNRDSPYAREDGLQGIALDPNFSENQRMYIYYSAPDVLVDRLSRFTLKDGKLDPASELKLIDVPIARDNKVCHHGGSVEFGPRWAALPFRGR